MSFCHDEAHYIVKVDCYLLAAQIFLDSPTLTAKHRVFESSQQLFFESSERLDGHKTAAVCNKTL